MKENELDEEYLEELYRIFGIDNLKDKNHIKALKKEIKRLKKGKEANAEKIELYKKILDDLKNNYEAYYSELLDLHYEDLKENKGAYDFLGIKTKEDMDKYLFGNVHLNFKPETDKTVILQKKVAFRLVNKLLGHGNRRDIFSLTQKDLNDWEKNFWEALPNEIYEENGVKKLKLTKQSMISEFYLYEMIGLTVEEAIKLYSEGISSREALNMKANKYSSAKAISFISTGKASEPEKTHETIKKSVEGALEIVESLIIDDETDKRLKKAAEKLRKANELLDLFV